MGGRSVRRPGGRAATAAVAPANAPEPSAPRTIVNPRQIAARQKRSVDGGARRRARRHVATVGRVEGAGAGAVRCADRGAGTVALLAARAALGRRAAAICCTPLWAR